MSSITCASDISIHEGASTSANEFTTEEKPTGIFGVPLQVSIRYANVAISLTNDQGESFVYGYVPIVVAKCGVFLKEKGMSPPCVISIDIQVANGFV